MRESDDGILAMQFTAGALSSTSLSLSKSTVGAYSDISVNFETMHDIPTVNGRIKIDFPKWNPGATDDKYQFQSYVDTQNSIVAVPCEKLTGFPAEVSLDCVFSTGATKDTLTVSLTSLSSNAANVAVGNLRFLVKGIRGPPTTKAVFGFVFSTAVMNTEGSFDVIDISTSPISLKVDNAESDSGSNMVVSADLYSIGKLSTLTFKVITKNPLDKDTSI